MGLQTASITTLSNDADGYAEAQTLGGAGAVTLDGALVSGGVGSSSSAQPVTITSVGNDSGVTFTITGTYGGLTYSEDLTGANASTATTTRVFDTVTSITADGATAADITAGPVAANGAASKILPANWRSRDFKVGFGVDITGTMTYKVQHTFDDIQVSTTNPTWFDHESVTGKTADADGNYAYPVRAYRWLITSYTNGSGTMKAYEN